MALSAGTVSLGVKADATGIGDQLSRDIKKEADSSGLSGIGKVIGGTLVAGIGLALVGIGAVVTTGIGETMDAAAGVAQLAAGIKSTGNAANVSVKGMTDLAASIQGMSGQTDDSIVKAQQLLLTFTNIRNAGPDKIFDQATLAAANMAAKMGGDASSNAILLGKALNDPVKGITALTRVGVAFTAEQKTQIAAMVAAGDTMGAQKIILGELQTEFGGAAEAAGKSLPGQLEIGRRAFEDMSQSIVETFLPIVTPAITMASEAMKRFAPVAQDVAAKVKDFLVQGFNDLRPVIQVVWGVLQQLGSFLVTTVIPAIAAFGGWVRDNSKWLSAIAAVILGAVVAFKAYAAIMGVIKIATIAWAAVQAVLNVILTANPIGLIVVAIGALVAGIIWVATQTTFFQDAWKVMSEVIGAVWDWLWTTILQPVFAAIGAVFTWLWEVIISPVVGFIVAYVQVWAAVLTWLWEVIIGPVFAAIGAVFTWLWEVIIQPVAAFIGGAIKTVGDTIGTVFGAVGDVIRGAFSGVVEFVRGIFNTIIGLVNGIIDGVNGASAAVAGITGVGIRLPRLPSLAAGATILPTPGGTIVRVAEGGKAESVVDTGKLNDLMGAAGRQPAHSSSDSPTDLSDSTIEKLARAIAGLTRNQGRQGTI